MYQNLHCIALRTVRHSDSKNLLSAWSREAGRISFAIPAGSGREAARRRSLTSPLAIFEGVSDLKPGREIFSIRDLRPGIGSLAMEASPVKGMTAMFLAEFLDLLLRRSEPDEALSDFLFASLRVFSEMTDATAIANFHLVFIYRLTLVAGIEPQTDTPGTVFDLRDGSFRAARPLHDDWLDTVESECLRRLARVHYNNSGELGLDRTMRNRLLDSLLRYYSIHLLPLTSLKSLEILRSL